MYDKNKTKLFVKDCIFRSKGKVKCIITEAGNIKIYPIDPKAEAYVGVDNVNEMANVSTGEKVPIEYVVRHKHSYQGGGNYGIFGGYDITLIRLGSPTNTEPACFPSTDYKDSGLGNGFDNIQNVMLAGYGRYYRAPCQTDDLGPSPSHYCTKGSKCNLSVSPPISEACHNFISNNPEVEKEFSDKNLHKVTVRDAGKNSFDCFRKTSYEEGSKGWCHVTDDASKIGTIVQTDSWGFCGKDCFLQDTENIEPDSSVLRSKDNIDVLSDELCSKFLLSAYEGITPEYVPEVLCIGYYKKSNIRTYNLSTDGKILEGKDGKLFCFHWNYQNFLFISYFGKDQESCFPFSDGNFWWKNKILFENMTFKQTRHIEAEIRIIFNFNFNNNI